MEVEVKIGKLPKTEKEFRDGVVIGHAELVEKLHKNFERIANDIDGYMRYVKMGSITIDYPTVSITFKTK